MTDGVSPLPVGTVLPPPPRALMTGTGGLY